MNWRDKLKNYLDENPVPLAIPLELRDTSGSMSRETMSKFAEEWDALWASGELKIIFFREDDEGNVSIEDEDGLTLYRE